MIKKPFVLTSRMWPTPKPNKKIFNYQILICNNRKQREIPKKMHLHNKKERGAD